MTTYLFAVVGTTLATLVLFRVLGMPIDDAGSISVLTGLVALVLVPFKLLMTRRRRNKESEDI
jgi:hypothetical protein